MLPLPEGILSSRLEHSWPALSECCLGRRRSEVFEASACSQDGQIGSGWCMPCPAGYMSSSGSWTHSVCGVEE